ncbi:hypothetical protein BABINDRAFT_32156 [Babjeviella inositovora NRRL Y-12698]|uniref:Amidase domain-containing protein n=1 Tax=Babjeviella inositovora NRRL Y-12698 TaxID=984486 RepID=A0A1E3QXG6_9ASCO|nr:uncharacterized protein BABINDRAFT_32156 [Babjeviella inositovora NRRL Y-12698]ODQ81762.1 hypothetical protein BABINDRAFT_32156 [Babjeviella inositovora NRRL Y-12698]
MTQLNDYKEIAAKKVALRDAQLKKEWLVPEADLPPKNIKDVLNFPEESGYLSASEIEITNADARTIVEKIKAKEWTSVEVTKAFCHRASIAHQLTNCLTEVFFDEALETAAVLDELYRETGKLQGPLHGLPISLKDCFNLKGKASSIGIVGYAFSPEGGMPEDAVLATILKDLGAVFYVKTNIPTAMMTGESFNNLWGRTLNPFNRDLTAGGSSGGEAALSALKGSPLSVGTDIGGSIRIPAAFQNIYGLRPSFGRFPTFGCRPGLAGFESVVSVNGPMARSIDALLLYSQAVIGAEPWLQDPRAIEIPWRSIELPTKLTFAVLWDDGICKPHPPILRGLQETVDKLKAAGHEVIEWDPRLHLKLLTLAGALFTSDGGNRIKGLVGLTGEPLLEALLGLTNAAEISTSKLWELQLERNIVARDYLLQFVGTASQTSSGRPIDGILLPAAPCAGAPHEKFKYVGYTVAYNVLDYTSATFPVTRADSSIDIADKDYIARNPTEKEAWDSYDAEQNHGGAVSIQLVGKRLEEEKVLAMLKVIAKVVDYKQ